MTPHRLLAALALAAATAPGWAQTPPVAALIAPPQNVLTLSSSATVEVPKDWLSVTLAATREGNDAGAVQGQLKQALDAALAEARKAATPGQIEVRTGAFSIYPRYVTKQGASVISGWQGTAELIIEGRDTAGLSQLSGRLQTLAVARVVFSLSREAREKVEAEVAATAIARFRTQAEGYAKQFGFAGYAIREVNVNTGGDGPPQPMMRMQASAAGDASLPVEAGRANVTANVSGSVQMSIR